MPTKREEREQEKAKRAWFRSVSKIRKIILNAKDVTDLFYDADGWTVVKYRGGGVFRMRGPAVKAAVLELETDAMK